MNNIFLERLSKNIDTKNRSITSNETDIYFMIAFDENGAYLQITNKKGKEISVDYRAFTGELYPILKSIDAIKEQMGMQFSWESEKQKIYLEEYSYLIYQLFTSSSLLDSSLKPIVVSEEKAKVILKIYELDKDYIPSISIKTKEKEISSYKFINDSFILSLVDNTIYSIEHIGANYKLLPYFLENGSLVLLEKYLSIFFSHIENVEVEYLDYKLNYSEDEANTSPAILFEKVAQDKSLFIRLISVYEGYDMDFIEQFNLSYIAINNSIDRKIVLKRLISEPLGEHLESIYKSIIKYAPTKTAKAEVYMEDNFIIIPSDTASKFLFNELPNLVSKYTLLGTEKLTDYRVLPVQPKLNLKLDHGIDFLEGKASISIEQETFSISDFLNQYKKQKYIVLSDGNKALVQDSYVRKLERALKINKGSNVKISFFDILEIEEMLQDQIASDTFKVQRKVYEGFNEISSKRTKYPKIDAILRPYQKEGYKWIKYLYENKLGGCLADDMGLGKTLQIITMLADIYPKEKKASLIIMPKSLLFNWKKELERFAPSLNYYTYYGGERDLDFALKAQIILTSYAVLRNDIEKFSKENFNYVILDESQNIKTLNSQTTQSVFLLKAKHRMALSGTPMENNLSELYSLFRFLNPSMFGSVEDFNRKYATPIQKEGDNEALISLKKKIYPFMLRRLKKDVLSDLPDKIEQTLFVEMSPKQAEFYEKRRSYFYNQIKSSIIEEGINKSQFMMFQALNELRRIASIPESLTDGRISSPKIDLLMEYVEESILNNHKVVIFFNYIAGLEIISEKLNEIPVDFETMTGSTRDRQSVVERFQNDSSCMVLLMTLKTGGVGLNLTAADTVFIFEPWWNKAAENQAIDRLHRFGQTAKVLSYSLVVSDSIEEKICLLQEKKSHLFDSLIGSDTGSTKVLSEEDINYILG